MSLLDNFKETFVILDKKLTPDGEGGYITEYEEGVIIDIAVAHNTTISAQIAESDNTASTYTFLIDKKIPLSYHDIVKRVRDGAIFRITQDALEDYTPSMSDLKLTKVTAERWELPND